MPAWFVSNLSIPDLTKSYPINLGPAHAGDIAFVPDLSADIWEKWVGFVAILSTGSLPMLLAAFSAHPIAGRAIVPMERLGAGLVRMREGDYDTVIPLAGPPEIRQFCQEANRLAATPREPGQPRPAPTARFAAGRRSPSHGARTSRRDGPASVRQAPVCARRRAHHRALQPPPIPEDADVRGT
ncbi:hypothetical protein [Bradyrhizobium japonicum]|uniref:hypothetical protein n=1 Tax=Bradyrhizobium japonicum TaxID=375 RepID=UPI002714F526|nr:hypothetical protein [Bradyrhizobium japonicum]WLB54730.1 hypothetical protein QIH94_01615 [Bradyrhizobium japonicum]WLB63395.1 hypothetical protein QIH96_44265 [Bradyrhizobium japonicum]